MYVNAKTYEHEKVSVFYIYANILPPDRLLSWDGISSSVLDTSSSSGRYSGGSSSPGTYLYSSSSNSGIGGK